MIKGEYILKVFKLLRHEVVRSFSMVPSSTDAHSDSNIQYTVHTIIICSCLFRDQIGFVIILFMWTNKNQFNKVVVIFHF